MALGGPEGQATGQEHADPPPGGAPFDLGDSRDLAAAVRAAWASGPDASAPTEPVGVPRPSPEDALLSVTDPGAGIDPLAHLRGEATRRSINPRFALPRIRRSTLLASLGVTAAILAAAAFPVMSAGNPRPAARVADERVRPTTSSTVRAASTTAFTYPPETLAPTETAPPPPTVAPPAPSAEGRAPARSAPTATTTRPRTATTTRRASTPTTKAPPPTTTTTQAPPPPDDGGGSGEPDQPPPYP